MSLHILPKPSRLAHALPILANADAAEHMPATAAESRVSLPTLNPPMLDACRECELHGFCRIQLYNYETDQLGCLFLGGYCGGGERKLPFFHCCGIMKRHHAGEQLHELLCCLR